MLLTRLMTSQNLGWFDRILRALPAFFVALLWWQGVLTGPVALLIAFAAAMLLATAVTGACSIYYLLGLSTRRRRPTAQGSKP